MICHEKVPDCLKVSYINQCLNLQLIESTSVGLSKPFHQTIIIPHRGFQGDSIRGIKGIGRRYRGGFSNTHGYSGAGIGGPELGKGRLGEQPTLIHRVIQGKEYKGGLMDTHPRSLDIRGIENIGAHQITGDKNRGEGASSIPPPLQLLHICCRRNEVSVFKILIFQIKLIKILGGRKLC